MKFFFDATKLNAYKLFLLRLVMKAILPAAVFVTLLGCQSHPSEADYKDASLTVDARVESLLSQMTLAEKVAQLQCYWNEKVKFNDAEGRFSVDSAKKHIPDGLGQIGRPSEGKTPQACASYTNAVQKYFVEETRLGIPVIFHVECLHGHAAPGRTSFSQPIGLASTWNVKLVEELYAMTALEARRTGAHLALTPVVDVARDPRWGRVEETFGEDPYLVGEMGLAAVWGFQGRDSLIGGDHVMATLKHFVAHGQPESGTNAGPISVGERTLREVFLHPFEQCVTKAKVRCIMASYNEVDGVPSHINSWLLKDVLREEWGFEGVVVSDYYAIEELVSRHQVTVDNDQAGLKALTSGVDVELPEPVAFRNLAQAVQAGQLDEQVIDRAVRLVLTQKFELGLFENPYVDEKLVVETVDVPAHHRLALQAARETPILLKNEGDLLPLDTQKALTIAVIGPNADRELLGGYSGEPSYHVTVLEGIRERFTNAKVLYAEGCAITKDSVLVEGKWVKTGWGVDPVELADREENLQKIREAKAIAAQADVVILCLGGNEQTSREAWAESHKGDRTHLQLLGEQEELFQAIDALGKPIVTLLFNGSPVLSEVVFSRTDALMECWYMGPESGHAIGDLISGAVSPSGKLPISIPRSVGHLPVFYNYKPTARRGYLFDQTSPLFAFGYGLSYTTFSYGKPTLSDTLISVDSTVTVRVAVTNQGDYEAQEVVQLYVRDQVSSVTRPIKELKGFEKIRLVPGETAVVHFKLDSESFAFWGAENKRMVEPGDFTIWVGSSSRDQDLQSVRLTLR